MQQTSHMPQADEAGDTQFVASVARALSILNTFRANDGPLGNAELAERAGITKPTASRLAYTLARCGYLNFNPRYRVYELGPSAISLGHIAMSAISVRQLARPLMRQLAHNANFNVGLGTRDQHLMLYTDAFEGNALVGLRLFAGSRLPILTSAMGRAYLAGLDEMEREQVLEELKPRYGDDWPTLSKAVAKSAKEFHEKGYCSSLGDWQKDIHGVAAPIRPPNGGSIYAVNLGGPSYLLSKTVLGSELGPRIAELARKVEAAMSPQAVNGALDHDAK